MKNSLLLTIMLHLLRISLGIFFLYTSVLKIPDLGNTALFLTRSNILPETWSMPLSCIGVAMEFIVGLCLLLRKQYKGAALWACVMSSTFLLLFVQAWMRGLDLSCNCTGSNAVIDNYPIEIGYRLLLFGACLLLCWDATRGQSHTWRITRPLDFSQAD